MHRTEMRLDPLTDEWTLFSEARARQPASCSVLEEPGDAATDPFMSGHEQYAPHTLHQATTPQGDWRVRVIPNRVPLLRIEGDHGRHGDGFYDRMDGVGAHEVVVETNDSRALETLDPAHIEQVIAAWKMRILDLMRDARLRSFSIIKAVGKPAGALVPHSVSQIVAMAVIPARLKRKLEITRAFYAVKKRSIFADILAEEVRSGKRIVYENHGFCVFCPYAARAPFELAIYPKRQSADFHAIAPDEIVQLADAVKVTLLKLNRALDHAPYHFALLTAPTRTKRADHWNSIDQDFRWHIEILPRLYPANPLETATASWVNSVWPEEASEYLRASRAQD
jgi:UDPglucose--hexose-1-phosphate uridylyltransferase